MTLFWREPIKTTVVGDTTRFDCVVIRDGDVMVHEFPGGSVYVVRRRWVRLDRAARWFGL